MRTVWIVLLLISWASVTRAAFRLPPELENASEQEQALYLQREGERSLQEKLDAGRERYQQRLAFRKALTDTMNTNRERREKVIVGQIVATSPPRGEEETPTRSSLYWVAALALFFVCGFLHFKIRHARK